MKECCPKCGSFGKLFSISGNMIDPNRRPRISLSRHIYTCDNDHRWELEQWECPEEDRELVIWNGRGLERKVVRYEECGVVEIRKPTWMK